LPLKVLVRVLRHKSQVATKSEVFPHLGLCASDRNFTTSAAHDLRLPQCQVTAAVATLALSALLLERIWPKPCNLPSDFIQAKFTFFYLPVPLINGWGPLTTLRILNAHWIVGRMLMTLLNAENAKRTRPHTDISKLCGKMRRMRDMCNLLSPPYGANYSQIR